MQLKGNLWGGRLQEAAERYVRATTLLALTQSEARREAMGTVVRSGY